MDLTPYLTSVAEDLDKVTALADPTTRETARRVATALEPALRLALVRAITDTTAQVSAELGDGAVTVYLRDGEPIISTHTGGTGSPGGATGTTGPNGPAGAAGPAGPAVLAGADGAEDLQDDTPTRLTLRLPESLKRRVDERAAAADVSVNTWITQALRRAVTHGDAPAPRSSRRISGWA